MVIGIFLLLVKFIKFGILMHAEMLFFIVVDYFITIILKVLSILFQSPPHLARVHV